MNKTSLTCALIVLASWAALPAAAAELEPGARIRWVSAAEPNTIRIGTLTGLSSDTLFVSGGRGFSAQPLPMEAVSRLEVSQGSPSHVGRYALIGGLSGGLSGMALAAFAEAMTTTYAAQWGFETESHVPYHRFFLVGAGIGAGIGALIGVPGPERWKPVDKETIKLGLGPAGPSLCLSLRY